MGVSPLPTKIGARYGKLRPLDPAGACPHGLSAPRSNICVSQAGQVSTKIRHCGGCACRRTCTAPRPLCPCIGLARKGQVSFHDLGPPTAPREDRFVIKVILRMVNHGRIAIAYQNRRQIWQAAPPRSCRCVSSWALCPRVKHLCQPSEAGEHEDSALRGPCLPAHLHGTRAAMPLHRSCPPWAGVFPRPRPTNCTQRESLRH